MIEEKSSTASNGGTTSGESAPKSIVQRLLVFYARRAVPRFKANNVGPQDTISGQRIQVQRIRQPIRRLPLARRDWTVIFYTAGVTAACSGLVSYLIARSTLSIDAERVALVNAVQEKLETYKSELTEAVQKQIESQKELPAKKLEVAEGVTKEGLADTQQLRDLISRISAQFITVLNTESLAAVKGQPESGELNLLLSKRRLPEAATGGTEEFYSYVQHFLQRYSGSKPSRHNSADVKEALEKEIQLRAKALADLDSWINEPLKAKEPATSSALQHQP